MAGREGGKMWLDGRIPLKDGFQLSRFRWRWFPLLWQLLSDSGQAFDLGRAAQNAVVAYADEAAWQDMHGKAADKLTVAEL